MNELFATAEKFSENLPEQGGMFTEMTPAATLAAGYRVLARKYRPSTFDQLIGQETMVRTLANAILTGRLPHAWMLTGVRGIGKTTTARIIARALNCTGPESKGGPTINPCGACDSCRTIAEDRNVDVMEMDAASRTGVDDIREIIDGVRYGPASSRYKIYILDEVHMLTKNAFNALLKTLEEPPPHTKFIFATTEIRKVPVTVLSRCQRFDLRRIDSDMLAKHFTDVALWEKVPVEVDAVRMIAHAADGSVRDGLSLLDQAIARGNGAVTTQDVKDMLGLADRGQSIALCRDILRGNVKDALATFTGMQQAGGDPLQILQDASDLVHLLTRGQVIDTYARDESLPEYDRQLLVELADIKIPALTRAWQILLKGIGEVQTASHPAQAAEMVLIRLAYASELPTPADLVRQLKETPLVSGSAAAKTVSPLNAQRTTSLGQTSGSLSDNAGHLPPRTKLTGTAGGAHGFAQPVTEARVVTSIAPRTEALAPVADPAPSNYAEVVALFSENREITLHAILYGKAHVVRCDAGVLEIRIEDDAPANIVGRVSKFLSEWTGKRWMVSLSDREGEPTLAERERQREKKRHEQVAAHPLMQAVMKTFPDAKMTSLRQKVMVTAPVTDDAALTEKGTELRLSGVESPLEPALETLDNED